MFYIFIFNSFSKGISNSFTSQNITVWNFFVFIISLVVHLFCLSEENLLLTQKIFAATLKKLLFSEDFSVSRYSDYCVDHRIPGCSSSFMQPWLCWFLFESVPALLLVLITIFNSSPQMPVGKKLFGTKPSFRRIFPPWNSVQLVLLQSHISNSLRTLFWGQVFGLVGKS